MNTETNQFRKLLQIKDLYSLYCKIDDSIKSDIDLYNSCFDYKTANNSINLLIELGFVQIKEEKFCRNCVLSLESFKEELLNRILNKDEEILKGIFNIKFRYDENNDRFFFYRNYLSLDYAGIVMLLEELGYILKYDTYKLYFRSEEKIRERSKKRKPISIEELKKKLEIQNILGNEAEIKAIDYENKTLRIEGINKKCKLISDIDVTAGYDIVSYLDKNSESFDKYIEVKSCDDSLSFNISSNEIAKAKIKGDSYFIYLYNRSRNSFFVIQNPYKVIFIENQWIYKANSYLVRKI